MIIDVHGHIGPWFFGPDEGTAEENVRAMDAYGIDLQFVSGVEAITYDPIPGNMAVAAAIKNEPRLRGLIAIDPRELDETEGHLDQTLATGVFVGAKIHTDYMGTPTGAPRMAAALELATAYDLPVLVHSWGTEILDLAETVASVPGARVIAGHMGGPDWQLAADAVRRTDRLWLEPCYSQPPADRIRRTLDLIGPERMLFGTDSTLIDPAYAIGAMQGARLTAREERLIMSENAQELFAVTGT